MKLNKYRGSMKHLRAIVDGMELEGRWERLPKPENGIRFRTSCGSILHWWPSTGSLCIEGLDQESFGRAFLETRAARAEQQVMALSDRVTRLRGKLKASRAN